MKISDDRKKREVIQSISAKLRSYDPNNERYYLNKTIFKINDNVHAVEVLSTMVDGVLWVIHFDIEGKLENVHNMPTDDELSQRIDELYNQEQGVK